MIRPRSRLRRGLGAVAACAVALLSAGVVQLAAPVSAFADTLLTFDDVTSNTGGIPLTNQYAGVTFGVNAPFHGPPAPLYIFPGSTLSPPNMASLKCFEACDPNYWAEFSSPQQNVSAFLFDTLSGPVSSTVVGYDANGTQVASTSFTLSPGVWQAVTLDDASGSTITYWEIVGPSTQVTEIDFDNFSFGGTTQPDYGLIPSFDTHDGVGVPVGHTRNFTLTLRRFGGSVGNIGLSVGALPAGVSVSLPTTIDGGDGTVINGSISVSPSASPLNVASVVINASPSPSAGPVHSITFPLTIQGLYGMRVQGMEITQGVQDSSLPARNPANLTAPVQYSGVKLADFKPTVVRVFADAPNAPPGGVQGVGASLTGFDASGHELPGSPLSAQSGPDEGGSGGLIDDRSSSLLVPDRERDSTSGSYDFVLPTTWNEGELKTLTVTLNGPDQLFGPPPLAVPCTGTLCQQEQTMTMTGMNWVKTGQLDLGVVILTNGGKEPANLSETRTWTRLIPAWDVNFSGVVGPDYGTIDIGWILAGCPEGPDLDCNDRGTKNNEALAFLQMYASNLGYRVADGLLGVTDQDLGVENGTIGPSNQPDAIVDDNRPVTDVDHEIGHMLGLQHASADCGGGSNGQKAVDWPPDQHGYINSIGLNITGSAPFTVIAGPGGSQRSAGDCGLPGPTQTDCGGTTPAQFFDFMSYCTADDPNADGTLGATNAWVSAKNWNQMATALVNGSAAMRRARVAVGKAADPVRVFGFTDPKDGTHIVGVNPATPGNAPMSGSKSSFTVVAVGKGGKAIASATMLATSIHVDGIGGTETLQGALPESAAGATKLEVMHKGKAVASLTRPSVAPKLASVTSTGTTTCSAKAVNVKWNVSDPKNLHLTAGVEFSNDGGKQWTQVFDGPAAMTKSGGSAQIPRSQLSTSKDAMIKVQVSDGYNQVSKTTTGFCVAASAPTVTIDSPVADQIVGGQEITLSGVASGADEQPVTGSALVWSAAGSGKAKPIRLGTGSPLVARLPAGATKVMLTAFSGGKSATATVEAKTPATTLTLQNGWAAAPVGNAAPSATVVSGVVHLAGAITTIHTNAAAFTLPPAMRPAGQVYVPVDMCGSTNGRLQIEPSGQVVVEPEGAFSDAQCFTSLDGASFALSGGTPLTLQNGWSGAPFGTAQPSATLISGEVYLRGAIAGGLNAPVFTLPPGMRPSVDVFVQADLCNAANGRLFIQPDGTVQVEAQGSFTDAQCFTSLDGVSFALSGSTPLTLENGWIPTFSSIPAATLTGGVVHLSGSIATSGTNPVPFTLPPALRPAHVVDVPVDLCNANNGKLDIQPTGVVTVQAETAFSNAQCFTSLEGVSYLANP